MSIIEGEAAGWPSRVTPQGRLSSNVRHLGTLGGSRSRGLFVTEAGAIIGMSGVKGHRTHALMWTEAGGMVEKPSLGRVENVDAASATGAFTGFTIDKKSNASLHAVLWAPSPASSKR